MNKASVLSIIDVSIGRIEVYGLSREVPDKPPQPNSRISREKHTQNDEQRGPVVIWTQKAGSVPSDRRD